MYYKVVNQFKKSSDLENWNNYMSFSGLHQITDFCSLDSNLNDSVFKPLTNENWENCVNSDFQIEFITTLEYARIISGRNPGSRIFGLIINPSDKNIMNLDNLLGFDILDAYFSNSLITNCGGFPDVFDNSIVSSFGLLDNVVLTYSIRDKLREKYIENDHAKGCEVVAVIDIKE